MTKNEFFQALSHIRALTEKVNEVNETILQNCNACEESPTAAMLGKVDILTAADELGKISQEITSTAVILQRYTE